MLKKKFRLPIQEMIKKNGRTAKTPFFLIKIFSSRFSYPRFGIIISKKVFQKATARNKLKRAIFSVVENFLKNEKSRLLIGKDFLIIVSSKTKDFPQKEIAVQLGEIFGKLNLR